MDPTQPALIPETGQARSKRIHAVKVARALTHSAETTCSKRLDAAKAYKTKAFPTETAEQRRKRLDAAKASRNKALATETAEQRRKRLDAVKAYKTKAFHH